MFITKWLVMTIAVLTSSYVIPGIEVRGLIAAFVAALILGFVNAFIRPLLIVLTFPITVVSLGFFLLILNSLMLMLVAALVSGFEIHGFFSAFIGSIFISIIGAFINTMVKTKH